MTNDNIIIQNAKKYIKELFKNNTDGHDFNHSIRVYQNALTIMETEQNCDHLVVSLASLLHDADDPKLFSSKHNENTIRFLKENNIPENKIKHICQTINSVSFSKNKDKKPDTIEGCIVQDADRLDAMGAIAIARTFAYGGHHKQSLQISVNHLYEKCIKLYDLLNTKRARELGEKRQQFLQNYLIELSDETNLTYNQQINRKE